MMTTTKLAKTTVTKKTEASEEIQAAISLDPRRVKISEVVSTHAARVIFRKRGNHTEAHLSELELRVIVQAAIQAAFKADDRLHDSTDPDLKGSST